MARRRPVPREWREVNHYLVTSSSATGYSWHRSSRTRGKCSCGVRWPDSIHVNNLDYAAVLDRWKDHVEEAYYSKDENDAR